MAPTTTPSGPGRGRMLRTAAQSAARIAAQAAAASIATWDPSDRTPPGTLTTGGAGPGRRIVRGHRRARLPGPLPVIIVLLGVLITGFGVQNITGITVLPSGLTTGSRPPPRKFPVLESSPPVAITIRSLNLNAPVHSVGVEPDGTIAVPTADRRDEAGWYDQSPTPGQYGPAVIVGHVDTRTGPAIFHDLGGVRAGAKVEIRREDRSVAVFEVNSVKRFGKSDLPVRRIYGDFSRPSLRLITCGGRWVGGETGYADNVVVFASLVSARQS